MKYFIFNLVDGNRELAASFLDAKRWAVRREERHRDALANGDLVLAFVAATREFVGRAKLGSAFLDPLPVEPAASAPAVSGVLLADADAWTRGVPLAAAVQSIDPTGSNRYVQASAAGRRRCCMAAAGIRRRASPRRSGGEAMDRRAVVATAAGALRGSSAGMRARSQGLTRADEVIQ